MEVADAVIYTWYPGEQGGLALADILFGNANPSGKLPISVPYKTSDLPAFEDYAMKGRTYRYSNIDPLFPFGFGLSYSTFQYSNLLLEDLRDTVKGTFTITNNSNQAAMEIFQVYTKAIDGSDPANCTLKYFDKIGIVANETVELSFELNKADLPVLDNNGKPGKLRGEYSFFVGSSSPHQGAIDLGAAKWLTSKLVF